MGSMLAARSICIFGLGAVALPLAKRLKPFGVKLIGLTREIQPHTVSRYGLDECFTLDQKDICLSKTDILIICTRLCAETQNSIGAHELSCLPAGSLVINIARGGLVEETALIEALRNGHLAGAGLDVYWREPVDTQHPLLRLENVISTPHIAGITRESLQDIASSVAKNINQLRSGSPLANVANLK